MSPFPAPGRRMSSSRGRRLLGRGRRPAPASTGHRPTEGWLALLTRTVLALCAMVGLLATSACGPTGSSASTASTTSTATRAVATASAGATDPASGLAWVNESALPSQARHTLDEIRAGGPYDYPGNDNVTYHNNNHVLPRRSDGYYREYTVRTPGSRSRGARRIIRGDGGELYYTSDHYSTFQRIREGS